MEVDVLHVLLPMLLYIAGITLLIVLIIVGIKLINILNRVERIADNVETKVSSFDHVFTSLGKMADGVANISDSIVFTITNAMSKIFKKKEEDKYYE